jgi:hypothetical protein
MRLTALARAPGRWRPSYAATATTTTTTAAVARLRRQTPTAPALRQHGGDALLCRRGGGGARFSSSSGGVGDATRSQGQSSHPVLNCTKYATLEMTLKMARPPALRQHGGDAPLCRRGGSGGTRLFSSSGGGGGDAALEMPPEMPLETTLEMLRMIPEFQEAEAEGGAEGGAAAAGLFRVLEICDNSVGAAHPMTAEVVARLLRAVCAVFSPYGADARLRQSATGLLARRPAAGTTSTPLTDTNAMAYLALALNDPRRAAAVLDAAAPLQSTSWSLPPSSSSSAVVVLATYHNLRGTALTLLGSEQDATSAFQDAFAVLDDDDARSGASNGQHTLATAQVHHNLGCCQAFVAADTAAAVDTWRAGLGLLQQWRWQQDENSWADSDHRQRKQISEAELLCNIGQIEINDPDASVREAGVAALAQALEILGDAYDVGHARTARVLALLARGYHLDGKAVSSEGLYRSALAALEGPGAAEVPSLVRQRISTLRGYAALLHDWEQREGDSTRQAELADALEEESGAVGDGGGSMVFPLSMCLPEPH